MGGVDGKGVAAELTGALWLGEGGVEGRGQEAGGAARR